MLSIVYGGQFPRCTEYCINTCESYDVTNYGLKQLCGAYCMCNTARRIVQFSPLVR